MEYHPLNVQRNEIRVLKILPPATQDIEGLHEIPASSDIVCCELKHVSLDDFTPQYRLFKPEYIPSAKDLLLKWKNRDPAESNKSTRFGSLRNLKHRLTTRFQSQQNDLDKSITPRYIWGDYAALSYIWGDPSAPDSILLNGFQTMVTSNLAAALRELRREPCPAKGLFLWVDALCINQNDLQERAQQVKRMRDIYSQAWTPVVWLGKSDEQSIAALDIIHNIHEGLDGNKDGVVETLKSELEFFGSRSIDSIYHIIGQEYWYRVWIIQELAMGGPEMPLLCGESRICWATFGQVVDFLFHNFDIVTGSAQYHQSRQLCGRLARIQKLLRLSEGEKQYPGNESFTAMLHLSHESRASDERDKIYGVLGLIYMHLAQLVVPDYSLDTTTVYTDFSKIIVGGLYNMNHVYRGNRSKPRKIWPSWVYDFGTEIDRNYFDHEIPFVACSGALAFAPIRDDSLNIFCSCVWIDTVQLVCRDSTNQTWVKSPEPTVPTLAASRVNHIPLALKDALWRTFCFDAKKSVTKPAVEVNWQCTVLGIPWCMDELSTNTNMENIDGLGWSDIFHNDYFSAFDRFRRANRASNIGGYPLENYFPSEVYPLLDPAPIVQSLKRMMKVMYGRRLVSTVNGWPGLGVCNTLPGDKICVIKGCNMPLILRPHGSHYEVVGEIYYHGVMYGEVMSWIEQGKAELKGITLC